MYSTWCFRDQKEGWCGWVQGISGRTAEGRVPTLRTTPPAMLRALMPQVSPLGYGAFKDSTICLKLSHLLSNYTVNHRIILSSILEPRKGPLETHWQRGLLIQGLKSSTTKLPQQDGCETRERQVLTTQGLQCQLSRSSESHRCS